MSASKISNHELSQLTVINQKISNALQQAVLFSDFAAVAEPGSTVASLLELARRRCFSAIKHTSAAFFLLDETSSDFVHSYSWPAEQQLTFEREIEHQIADHLFQWALKRQKPVFVKAGTFNGELLLHTLSVKSEVYGMFICKLGQTYHSLEEYQLNLLSLVLNSCAGALKNRAIGHGQRVNDEESTTKTFGNSPENSETVIHENVTSTSLLASGLAHEINNPLNYIRTNLSCLEMFFADIQQLLRLYGALEHSCSHSGIFPQLTENIASHKAIINFDFIMRETGSIFRESSLGFDRIGELIRILTDFSDTGQSRNDELVDLNRLLEETEVFCQKIWPHQIHISKDFGTLSPLEGVPVQIKQALLNILLNSIQAAEIPAPGHTGRITITTKQERQTVSCIIRDNGPGIPENVQQHVFNPFFTSQEPGKGKGLGLSTAYDIIVLKHKGNLSLSCPETGGTIITISLPVTQPQKDQ
jgi:signal transduction histidine kinase